VAAQTRPLTQTRRRLVVVVAGLLVLACDRAMPGRAEEGPDRGPGPGPQYTLVYERVVGGNQDLYVVETSTGLERRLTDHRAQDGMPRFTPDGRRVIFSSDRSGSFQLYEVALSGGEPRRLRSNGFTEWQADLAPDGTSLAFLSKQRGPECLFLMDLKTQGERLLVCHKNRSILGNTDFSPDGRQITFSSNHSIGHQIYLLEVATGSERRLSGFRRGGCEPRFHPDGTRVVYVSRGHLAETSRLAELDLRTGQEKILVNWPALNYDPVYSPDGSELAFASNITGEYAIYRQNLTTGKSWRVTHGQDEARYPDYRPLVADR